MSGHHKISMIRNHKAGTTKPSPPDEMVVGYTGGPEPKATHETLQLRQKVKHQQMLIDSLREENEWKTDMLESANIMLSQSRPPQGTTEKQWQRMFINWHDRMTGKHLPPICPVHDSRECGCMKKKQEQEL